MNKVNQSFYKLLQVFDLIFCLTWIFHDGRTHYVIGMIDCSVLWKFFFKQIYHSERLLHDYPVMQFEIEFSKRWLYNVIRYHQTYLSMKIQSITSLQYYSAQSNKFSKIKDRLSLWGQKQSLSSNFKIITRFHLYFTNC